MSTRLQKRRAIEELAAGQTTRLREHGNSMHPRLKSGEVVILEPVAIEDVEVGDAVFCRVRGRMFTHLVKAKKGGPGKRQVLIGNNHGHVNGWTSTVYGRVIGTAP